MIDQWHNCYDSNWNGLIVPDAFAHPAKYAHGLIDRIFRFMLAEGMVVRGDKVVDPFGGIGTGGIVAASLGLQWFGCELEPKFHALGLKNFDLHLQTWQVCRDPVPVLVNGDSRKLRENLRGVLAQAVVCSPPFCGAHQGAVDASSLNAGACERPWLTAAKEQGGYGSTPGQLGAMKAGDVAAVVSSPPYEPDVIRSRDPGKEGFTQGLTQGKHSFDAYGDAVGNIANLPPGAVDAVVTSPPFQNQEPSHAQGSKFEEVHRQLHPTKLAKDRAGMFQHEYGKTEGNIGNTTGETFWHAARDIVSECYAILRPGGHAAFVVKAFVRNKQIVDFPGDWRKLCEACGFECVQEVHAMLVKEERHPDLFGDGDHVKTIERKSFFRRLAEKKGSPRIDFEVVQFFRKQ
jgi:hypothetical protein